MAYGYLTTRAAFRRCDISSFNVVFHNSKCPISVESPLAALLLRLTREEYIYHPEQGAGKQSKGAKKGMGDPIYAQHANPFPGPTNPLASKHFLGLVAFRVIKVGLGYKKGRCVHLYEFLVSEEKGSFTLSTIHTTRRATEFQLIHLGNYLTTSGLK